MKSGLFKYFSFAFASLTLIATVSIYSYLVIGEPARLDSQVAISTAFNQLLPLYPPPKS
jgi:hypothetical protein